MLKETEIKATRREPSEYSNTNLTKTRFKWA